MRPSLMFFRVLWQGLTAAAMLYFWALWLWVVIAKLLPRFAYLSGRPVGVDSPCIKPECDFSDFWLAGLSARGVSLPPMVLQPGVHMQVAHEYLPYPPPTYIFLGAISHLPFELGFFVWVALGLVLAVVALRWARQPWQVITAGLLSPAALWNFELGQLGLIGGALLVAGLLRLPEAPRRAGALLGLLAFKPQIGILVPAALLGAKSWRGVAGFGLAVLMLCLLVFILFGPGLWWNFFHDGQQGAASLLGGSILLGRPQSHGVSVLWMLRSLHAGMTAAWAGQIACSVAAFWLTARLWGQTGRSTLERASLTVMLSLLATPYGYTDDMVALSLVLAALAQARGWQFGVVEALAWLWPCFCPLVLELTGAVLTPLVVLAVLLREELRGRAAPATRSAIGA